MDSLIDDLLRRLPTLLRGEQLPATGDEASGAETSVEADSQPTPLMAVLRDLLSAAFPTIDGREVFTDGSTKPSVTANFGQRILGTMLVDVLGLGPWRPRDDEDLRVAKLPLVLGGADTQRPLKHDILHLLADTVDWTGRMLTRNQAAGEDSCRLSQVPILRLGQTDVTFSSERVRVPSPYEAFELDRDILLPTSAQTGARLSGADIDKILSCTLAIVLETHDGAECWWTESQSNSAPALGWFWEELHCRLRQLLDQVLPAYCRLDIETRYGKGFEQWRSRMDLGPALDQGFELAS